MSQPNPTIIGTDENTGVSYIGQVVKFYGNSGLVPHSHPVYVSTLAKLTGNTTEIAKIANANKLSKSSASDELLWNGLLDDMSILTNYLSNPESNVKRYQLDLILQGLLPYVGNMTKKMHLDKIRFQQINTLISNLTNTDSYHPAIVLSSIDLIVIDIKSKNYFWKSELQTTLENAVARQWTPIIMDIRAMLQNIGSKCIFLGLIGVVGWPMAMLYPLLRVSQTLFKITQEMEKQKRVSMDSIIDLLKTIAIIFASMQILAIISLYNTMGYFCLFVGSIAVGISSSNSLIKQVAPVIAPHLSQIDIVLSKINTLDQTSLSTLMSSIISNTSANTHTHNNNNFPTSARVEELPPNNNKQVPKPSPILSTGSSDNDNNEYIFADVLSDDDNTNNLMDQNTSNNNTNNTTNILRKRK
eukprot:gene11914-15943_t